MVQVTRGKTAAETTVKEYESSQSSEDRHAGWRYFVEKTGIKPGTSPAEATHKRQAELEQREQQAMDDLDSAPKSQ